MRKIFAAVLMVAVLLCMSGCNPTRKGQTDRCTICGSRDVVYHSDNYGYCQEHFEDMVEYGN